MIRARPPARARTRARVGHPKAPMSQLPHALVESLRLRRAVLVAGARCSALADLPGWHAIAERLVDRVADREARDEIRGLCEGRRVLAALARLRAVLADDVIAAAVREAVPAGRPLPAAI